MRKKEFIKSFAEKIGVPYKQAKFYYREFIQTLLEGLWKDKEVRLHGFGRFYTYNGKRKIYNIHTKKTEEQEIKTIKFQPSIRLKGVVE